MPNKDFQLGDIVYLDPSIKPTLAAIVVFGNGRKFRVLANHQDRGKFNLECIKNGNFFGCARKDWFVLDVFMTGASRAIKGNK